MPDKTHVLTLRLPRDLKERFERAADEQGVSMNQFAIYLFTRGMGDLEVAAFLRKQYAGKDKRQLERDFDRLMDRVPARSQRPSWDAVDS